MKMHGSDTNWNYHSALWTDTNEYNVSGAPYTFTLRLPRISMSRILLLLPSLPLQCLLHNKSLAVRSLSPNDELYVLECVRASCYLLGLTASKLVKT